MAGRSPPYIPIGVWWHCSNGMRFISLVKMSFIDLYGGLKRSLSLQEENFFSQVSLYKGISLRTLMKKKLNGFTYPT